MAAMGIADDLIAKVAAEKLRDRRIQNFTGKIPECNIDSAENTNRPETLRPCIKHVVMVDRDSEGILADQAQVLRRPLIAHELGDDLADIRTGAMSRTIAGNPSIGVDPQDRSGRHGQLQGLYRSDLKLLAQRGC
jgi:hypothetical protein